jgi:SRSO17 transposase
MKITRVQCARVEFSMDAAAVGRLTTYFENIGRHLPRREQRESFATYFYGLLSDGERKSVEPIAARACGESDGTQRAHDRLLHFLAQSPWSDRAVRAEAARYAIAAMERREPVTTWIIDDTGFLKQGSHSVGVQRQYTGSAGKIANCQIGVSLCVASRTEHVPIDFELYLPESWINSPTRRKEARIPDEITFKTKPELALDLVVRALDDKLPGQIVLADAAYGNSVSFRNGLVTYGLDFAVGVNSTTKVWLLDTHGNRRGDALSALDVGLKAGRKGFAHVLWRDGTRGTMFSKFCFRRVIVANDDSTPVPDRDPLWLVVEWPDDEQRPTKFTLTTLPRRMSKKQIARTIKERWRTEIAYEEMKLELGLDHYEGRSFPGWNHHVSVVLSCYAFVAAERLRRFSPSAPWIRPPRPNQRAT